jgi:tetratricopeptide (TPR) repeat protein
MTREPMSAVALPGPAGFGVIAERFRRAGQADKAVSLCREGLETFPDHLSARVTLGWALLDLGEYQAAFAELKSVVKRAPDNLAAIRGLAELHERGVSLDHESFAAMEADHDLDPLMEPMDLTAPPVAATVVEEPAIETTGAIDEQDATELDGDFDPYVEPMSPIETAWTPLPGLTRASEPKGFAIEDVIDDSEIHSDFDLSGMLDAPPVSMFERAPLALRDEVDQQRVDRLHDWLDRVRERRTETVAQYDMAG